MKTWSIALAVLGLAGAIDIGWWAFDEVSAPMRAARRANAEAVARGIEWPLEHTFASYRGAYHFHYCNPAAKTEVVEISTHRDSQGKWVVELSEKDAEKWPRLNADSH